MCPYYSMPCWAAENEIEGTWCHVGVSTDLGEKKKKRQKKRDQIHDLWVLIFFLACK